MTRRVTVTPPAGYFAAVQIEERDGTIVGADTCQNPDGTPRGPIAVTVKGDSTDLRARWVYENSAQGTVVMPLAGSRAGSSLA